MFSSISYRSEVYLTQNEERLPVHETIDFQNGRKLSTITNRSSSSDSIEVSRHDASIRRSKFSSYLYHRCVSFLVERSIFEVRTRRTWICLLAECLAEAFGTAILVLFGCSGVAQYILSRGVLASFLSVNFAFGFGAMIAVYVAGPVSGAHLNPAVSIAMLSLRSITALQCLTYILSRLFACFFLYHILLK